jgi:hypothetical protein
MTLDDTIIVFLEWKEWRGMARDGGGLEVEREGVRTGDQRMHARAHAHRHHGKLRERGIGG